VPWPISPLTICSTMLLFSWSEIILSPFHIFDRV
jgi:hypothetical protein